MKKNSTTEEKWGFAAFEEAVKHAYWSFFREPDLDSKDLGRRQESARPKDLLLQRYVSIWSTLCATIALFLQGQNNGSVVNWLGVSVSETKARLELYILFVMAKVSFIILNNASLTYLYLVE